MKLPKERIEPAQPFAGRIEKDRIALREVRFVTAMPMAKVQQFVSREVADLRTLDYIPEEHVIHVIIGQGDSRTEFWVPLQHVLYFKK